ncbi:hypothetical protein JXA85_04750 [Candidatus Woesearchaeota archaeon]|nr:hypothetical protein [Candidatus Woesearchaeota archaeon]
MDIKKVSVELIFLIAIFGTLLWMGLGGLSDYKLEHGFPTGYLASDNYAHVSWAEHIKNEGNYRKSGLSTAGGFPDVIGHYPMMHSHLSAIFSMLSGLETYDTMLFLTFFFSCFSTLIVYFMLRRYDRNIAILSVPLATFLFVYNFYFILLWGQYAMLFGNFFAILSIWAFSRIELKHSGILLGLGLSAAFQSHPPEMIICSAFIVFIMVIRLILKNVSKKEMIELAKAAAVFLLATLYYLMIFVFAITRISISRDKNPLLDLTQPHMEYLRTTLFSHFHIASFVIVAGALAFLLLAKKLKTVFQYSAYALLFGFCNYLGGKLGSRSLAQRSYWPITLAPLFGLGLFQVIKLTKIKWKKTYSVFLSAIIVIGIVNAYYQKMSPHGLVEQNQWNGIKWLNENTPLDSEIYFFYGDTYNQGGIMYNVFRKVTFADSSDFVNKLSNKIISRHYLSYLVAEISYKLPYRKSTFDYGAHMLEMDKSVFESEKDICSFDYLLFDKVSIQPVLAQYNMAIRNAMLSNNWIEEVYSNDVVSIIHNKKPGEECIPMEGIKLEVKE